MAKKRKVSVASRARRKTSKSAGAPWWPPMIAVLAIIILALIGTSLSKAGTKEAGAATISGQTLYVGTSGLDSNTGKQKTNPLRSLKKAFSLAQSFAGATNIKVIGSSYEMGSNDDGELGVSGPRSVTVESDTGRIQIVENQTTKVDVLTFGAGIGAGQTFKLNGFEFPNKFQVRIISGTGFPPKFGAGTILVSNNKFNPTGNDRGGISALSLHINGAAKSIVSGNEFLLGLSQTFATGLEAFHTGWSLTNGSGVAGTLDVRNNKFIYAGDNQADGIFAMSQSNGIVNIYDNTFGMGSNGYDFNTAGSVGVYVGGTNNSLIQIQANKINVRAPGKMIVTDFHADPKSQIIIKGN